MNPYFDPDLKHYSCNSRIFSSFLKQISDYLIKYNIKEIISNEANTL